MNGQEWYKEQLSKSEWKRKRQDIYRRDNHTCVDCGAHGVRIQCHHVYYVKGMMPWEYPVYAFVTVCDSCHEKRHKYLIHIHETHEDAEVWIVFTDLEQQLMEEEIANAEDRIAELCERGATWDSEGRYYGLVDEHGKSRFFDEDGNPL